MLRTSFDASPAKPSPQPDCRTVLERSSTGSPLSQAQPDEGHRGGVHVLIALRRGSLSRLDRTEPPLTRPSQLNAAQGMPMRRAGGPKYFGCILTGADGMCLAGFWDASKKRVLLWATQRCRERKTHCLYSLAQMGDLTVSHALLLCA